MYECVGVDLGWKRRGREAAKGMVLDASCDPLWNLEVGRELVSR